MGIRFWEGQSVSVRSSPLVASSSLRDPARGRTIDHDRVIRGEMDNLVGAHVDNVDFVTLSFHLVKHLSNRMEKK